MKPEFTVTVFQCEEDVQEVSVFQTDESFTNTTCPDCGPELSESQISYTESSLLNYQKVQMQETPENVLGGDNLQAIDITLIGDITGNFSPGDRVVATGILRENMSTVGNNQNRSIPDTYVQGFSLTKEQQEFEELIITDSDETRIEELANSYDIYERLSESIASSIYGYEYEKLALVLQLFSGVTKV